MSTPDRIHFQWNAADAFDSFTRAGVTFNPKDMQPSAIHDALADQAGRLFRLVGRTATTDVIVRVIEATDMELVLEQRDEPAFVGRYRVVDEPPPLVTVHGDIHFDVTR
jgi:hypothetical protein